MLVVFINCAKANIYLQLRPSHLLNKDEKRFIAQTDIKKTEIMLVFELSCGALALKWHYFDNTFCV